MSKCVPDTLCSYVWPSVVYPGRYTIPRAHARINSVPSILVVSTVRLDILDRNKPNHLSNTNITNESQDRRGPHGVVLSFPFNHKNKKRKRGCWLPFWLPRVKGVWPRLSVVEQSMDLRATDGFHASCEWGSVQLISPRPCECLICARPSKQHIELNTLVSSIPQSP